MKEADTIKKTKNAPTILRSLLRGSTLWLLLLFIVLSVSVYRNLAHERIQAHIFVLTPTSGDYSHKGHEYLRSVLLAVGESPSENLALKVHVFDSAGKDSKPINRMIAEVERINESENQHILGIVGIHSSGTLEHSPSCTGEGSKRYP